MMTDAAGGEDVVAKIGRCIGVVRDALLAALIFVGIAILWSLWPHLKELLRTASIESISLGAVSIRLGVEKVASFQSTAVTMDAVGGTADILEKGSLQDLTRVELQGAKRIDLIGISQGHTYSGSLLLTYISRLAPKYVILRNSDKLEAWVDAGIFAAQLNNNASYPYEQLISTIHGLRRESIAKTVVAREALEEMQRQHIDHLPAVDNEHRFLFMLSREEILAKVVTSVVLGGRT
jgi:hypothetical protein